MPYQSSKVTKAARSRKTLELLESAGGSGKRSELWTNIVGELPLDDEERATVSGGRTKGLTDWLWSTTNMVKAGWLTKDGNGGWFITESGRDALAEYSDPTDFVAAALDGYAQWDKEKKEALATRIAPVDEQQKRVIRAAEYFVERAFASGESVFAPGRAIWTPDVLEEIDRRFVQAESMKATYIENLEAQFADASDDARLLIAELVTLQLLPASIDSIGEEAKRERISRLLRTMDHPVVIPAEIDDAFASGSFSTGQLLSGHIVNSLVVIVTFAASWVRLEPDVREKCLGDPWAFRDFIAGLPKPNIPSQRLALMYLVHPETFIDVVASDAREAIRNAFIGEIGQSTGDLDLDLYRITIELQKKLGGPVNFYKDPLRSQWQVPKSAPPPTALEAGAEELAADTGVVARASFPAATQNLADHLNASLSWVQDTLDLIERRRQVIFFGPPGTGKTSISRRLLRGTQPVVRRGSCSFIRATPTRTS